MGWELASHGNRPTRTSADVPSHDKFPAQIHTHTMTDWKRKLAAYLHDPPSKALDIKTHGERSDAAFRQAGFTDEEEIGEYFAHADHTGAAADRLPFPKSQAAGLQCAFDGVRNPFRHPLNRQPLPLLLEAVGIKRALALCPPEAIRAALAVQARSGE
jgi:hypothetical protein